MWDTPSDKQGFLTASHGFEVTEKKQQQQILPSSSDFQKIIAFKILSINPNKLEGRKHVNKTNDI